MGAGAEASPSAGGLKIAWTRFESTAVLFSLMAIILASLPLLSAAPPTSIPWFKVPKLNVPKVDLEPLRTGHRKLQSSDWTAYCNTPNFDSAAWPCPGIAFISPMRCVDACDAPRQLHGGQ